MPMRQSRFTEEQIAFALKQAETGTPVLEVCRKLGVSRANRPTTAGRSNTVDLECWRSSG